MGEEEAIGIGLRYIITFNIYYYGELICFLCHNQKDSKRTQTKSNKLQI